MKIKNKSFFYSKYELPFDEIAISDQSPWRQAKEIIYQSDYRICPKIMRAIFDKTNKNLQPGQNKRGSVLVNYQSSVATRNFQHQNLFGLFEK